MLMQSQAVEGEGSGQPTKPQHTPTTASPSHSSGPTTLVADETVHEEREDSVKRAATTATSLDAEQGSGDRPAQTRFERLSKQSNEPPLSRVNTLGSGEDNMKLQELIGLCTKMSDRVLDLENVKNAQALEIQKLKKRVKKLESKKKLRTPQLKRRLLKVMIESSIEKNLGDPEDASKQGRKDKGISWFQEDLETQGRHGYDIGVNTASTSITTASTNITTAEPVTTASAPVTTDGVSVSTIEPKPSESGTRVRVPPLQIDLKDKGKEKMVEPKKPKKKKDQIEYDADVAQRLQAELDKEAMLEREREEEASKAANIIEWDGVQAMMDEDYELVAKLHAEE
ncbi:hypothetical protein Tco_1260657 [Tanacetum coccineum]